MFVVNPQYAYLGLCSGFLVVWVLIYMYSPAVRYEQLRMSLISIPGGPLIELLYLRDYWHPKSAFPIRIGPIHTVVEDILFAFAFVGITAVLYQLVTRRSLKADPMLPGGVRITVIAVALVSFLLIGLGANSIFATSVGFLVAAAWMITQRSDLEWPSLWSGFLTAAMIFSVYIIEFSLAANTEEIFESWGGNTLYHTEWGHRRFFGIPVTELIWAFSFGTLFGPLYAFGRRMRYV